MRCFYKKHLSRIVLKLIAEDRGNVIRNISNDLVLKRNISRCRESRDGLNGDPSHFCTVVREQSGARRRKVFSSRIIKKR